MQERMTNEMKATIMAGERKKSLPFGIPVILNSMDIKNVGLKPNIIFLSSI